MAREEVVPWSRAMTYFFMAAFLRVVGRTGDAGDGYPAQDCSTAGNARQWQAARRLAGDAAKKKRQRVLPLREVGFLFLDGARGDGLFHQVVVPFAIDFDGHQRAEVDGFDEVVREVGVYAGLLEGVHRSPCRAGGDDPGFQVLRRLVGEVAAFPDVVAVSADEVRVGLAVGLRVVDHQGFANFRGGRVFAGVCAFAVAKGDVGGNQAVHDDFVVGIALVGAFVAFVFAVFVFGQVEVLFADVDGFVVFVGSSVSGAVTICLIDFNPLKEIT